MRVEAVNDILELVHTKGEVARRRPIVVLLWHKGSQQELVDLPVLRHVDCSCFAGLLAFDNR